MSFFKALILGCCCIFLLLCLKAVVEHETRKLEYAQLSEKSCSFSNACYKTPFSCPL